MSNKILPLCIGILIGAALVGGYTITRLDSMKESMLAEIEEKYRGYDTESIVDEVTEELKDDIEDEVSSQMTTAESHLETYIHDVIEYRLTEE